MPLILGIDTATDVCSVALLDNQQHVTEKQHTTPREHTQHVLPMLEALLEERSVKLKDVHAIAFSAGPGSFTGLRIGLSVAQGLAYGTDIPLVAVSTLEAMALRARRLLEPPQGSVIVPVIDARMDEVYWGQYEIGDDGVLPVSEEKVDSPDNCLSDVIALSNNSLYGVGSGWHYPILQELSTVICDAEFCPSAYDVVLRGLALYEAGNTISPQEAQPTYLRNEISWQKRQRIRKTH